MIQAGMRPDQLRSTRDQKSRSTTAKSSGSRTGSQNQSAPSEKSIPRDNRRSASPDLNMDVDKHAATIYRSAMDGIRGTTFRRRQEKRKRAPSPLSSTTVDKHDNTALICGAEFVGDDWLIEDMEGAPSGPHVSRDAAKILYTSSERAPAEKRKQSSFLKGSSKKLPSPVKSTTFSSNPSKRRNGK